MRWRCRRGTRELDALLTWYLSHRFVDANADEQGAFERLLEAQDPDVYDWCMGRASPPDAGIAGVIDAIRAHHFV
jgi:antitoxin CptB